MLVITRHFRIPELGRVVYKLVIIYFANMKYRCSLLRKFQNNFRWRGVRFWYNLQASFTPNFRILTQLLKILEFCHADLNFKFSLFSKTKNFINLTFFTYIRIPGRRLYRKKIESCRWEIFEKLVKDSTTLYLDFFLHIIKIQTIKYVASEQRWS